MLLNCNALSAGRVKNAQDDMKKFSKLINDMRKDLDYIFKKVRIIKTKLGTQHPDAMAEVQSRMNASSLSDGSENDEVGVIAEEHMTETTTAAQSSPQPVRQVPRKSSADQSTSVGYEQLRHESEASSSPASNDAISIDRK